MIERIAGWLNRKFLWRHGWGLGRHDKRPAGIVGNIPVIDDDEWEGCPHGVIEGICYQCRGITEEEARAIMAENSRKLMELMRRQRPE